MELKKLNKFTYEYNLEKEEKFIKYLIIFSICVLFIFQFLSLIYYCIQLLELFDKNLQHIKQLNGGIQHIVSIMKELHFQQEYIVQELKCLRNKVLLLQKNQKHEKQIKNHNQPKLLQHNKKIKSKYLQSKIYIRHTFKHHLDDIEILISIYYFSKSILWNQYKRTTIHKINYIENNQLMDNQFYFIVFLGILPQVRFILCHKVKILLNNKPRDLNRILLKQIVDIKLTKIQK
ncbi:unnamed protein product [Paramecium sonneborni]|uniref:Transmembrane protein n=1 Tax=Paramecium sonneborni TaxID=65129 RepID=A0A8S1N5Q1_9CILI|nr:unnamed protein product [Paramecium sonneborni]